MTLIGTSQQSIIDIYCHPSVSCFMENSIASYIPFITVQFSEIPQTVQEMHLYHVCNSRRVPVPASVIVQAPKHRVMRKL